jgi:gas vesicle protein
VGEDPDVIRRQLERTREQLTETIDALGYKADVPARAKDRVTDTIDRAKGAIGGTMDHARDTMSGTSDAMREHTPDSQELADRAGRAVGVAQENPLGLAIGSVAAGFLLGMLVPSSRMEDERIGPMADSVKSHAVELGQEALEHGKEVASTAAEAASDVTRQQAREEAQELREEARAHSEAVTQEVRGR